MGQWVCRRRTKLNCRLWGVWSPPLSLLLIKSQQLFAATCPFHSTTQPPHSDPSQFPVTDLSPVATASLKLHGRSSAQDPSTNIIFRKEHCESLGTLKVFKGHTCDFPLHKESPNTKTAKGSRCKWGAFVQNISQLMSQYFRSILLC